MLFFIFPYLLVFASFQYKQVAVKKRAKSAYCLSSVLSADANIVIPTFRIKESYGDEKLREKRENILVIKKVVLAADPNDLLHLDLLELEIIVIQPGAQVTAFQLLKTYYVKIEVKEA